MLWTVQYLFWYRHYFSFNGLGIIYSFSFHPHFCESREKLKACYNDQEIIALAWKASKVYQKHYVMVVLGLNTCQVWGKRMYVCLKCFKIWRIRKSFSEVSSHVFEMWKENNTLRQKLFLFTYCEEFETSSTNLWDQNLSNHSD